MSARQLHPSPELTGGREVSPWGAFCQLYVVALAGASVLVASQVRRYLPDRFRLDALYIESTLRVPDGSLDAEDPFRNIALVYRALGLTHAPDVAAMLALVLFGVAVFAALRWEEIARLSAVGLGVVTVCYGLALIYLAQYSKEFVSLGLAALLLLLPRGRWADVLIVAGMLGYAATIRPYWAIVAGLYVAGRVLIPRLRGLPPLLGLVFVTYVGLQVVFKVVLGEALNFQRVAVNQVRADINTEVGSLIVDFLPADAALQSVNAFLLLASLLVPWPLLLGGSVTYLVMAVVLCFLWGLVGWSIVRLQRERRSRSGSTAPPPVSTSAPLSERTPRPERAVALLVALVVVQAIFEPDYGSYVKHLSPVLPLFLTLLPLSRSPLSRVPLAHRRAADHDPVDAPTGEAAA